MRPEFLPPQRAPHARPQPLGVHTAKLPIWPHIFMALFGVGWAIAFHAGVRLYGAELVTLVGLIIVPWWATLRRYPMAGQVLGAYALSVVAIAIADTVNGTALFDTARNIATPILGGLTLLVVLASVSRNPKALLTFLAATVLAKAALGEAAYGDRFGDVAVSLGSLAQDTNFFKVRIDPFLTPAVLLAACLVARHSLLRAALILGIACVGYLAVDARSTGFILFLSAVVLTAIHFRFKPKLGQLVAAGGVTLFVAYGAYVSYVKYTLTFNPDGHNGQQIVRMANPYNPIELVLRGRSDWLVMGSAIAERPIFGWGSWAIDTEHRFSYLRADRIGSSDYGRIGSAQAWGYIPAHSLVGSAWLWSGIIGFLAMVWLLRIVFAMAIQLPRAESRFLPVVIFYTLMLSWHFLFSPPQTIRLFFPVALAGLIVVTRPSLRGEPSPSHGPMGGERRNRRVPML